jgi:hypothetical protein
MIYSSSNIIVTVGIVMDWIPGAGRVHPAYRNVERCLWQAVTLNIKTVPFIKVMSLRIKTEAHARKIMQY